MLRQLRWRAVAKLLILLAAMAFVASAATAATSHQDSLQVQGQRRTFRSYLPTDSREDSTLPIMVVLHGGLDNGTGVARETRLANYVDSTKFIAVFPDSNGKQWNDGRRTTASRGDDVAFLRALIALVVQKWRGDPARVFIAGISNGGMMALRMACEASDIFTAVGTVVANMPVDLIDRCKPARPIPIVMFNGTRDRLMPWDGGSIPTSRIYPGGAGGEVVSTLQTFNFWMRQDGCSQPNVTTLSGTSVRRYTATGCRSNTKVTLYELDSGHGWPGGTDPQGPIALMILGRISQEINASAILISFFGQYGL